MGQTKQQGRQKQVNQHQRRKAKNMREDIKKRLTSKVVWLSVLAQVLVIVAIVHPEIRGTVEIISVALLEILTAFGVLNNPTDKENF